MDVYGVCQDTSVPMTELIKNQIEEEYDKDELQNREITTRYVELDWIFNSDETEDSYNFKNLVNQLVDHADISVFRTDLVKSIVTVFWDEYYT